LSWWLRQVVSEVSGHLALVATRGVLQELIPPFDWSPWRNLIWNLGSLVICWELRHELLEACRLIVLVLCYFLSFLCEFAAGRRDWAVVHGAVSWGHYPIQDQSGIQT